MRLFVWRPRGLASFVAVVIVLLFLGSLPLAHATPPPPPPPGGATDLITYGAYLETVLENIVKGLRTILFFVLIIGLMWFVAMFVSGRPAVKPIVTVLVAAVMLGGIQVILNTFLKTNEDNALSKSPPTILQVGP